MADVKYLPQSMYASDRVSFAYPNGDVELLKGMSVSIPDEGVKWLLENSEEFKTCVKMSVIILSDYTEAGVDSKPPELSEPTPTTKTVAKTLIK
jgi:hypothetical protein